MFKGMQSGGVPEHSTDIRSASGEGSTIHYWQNWKGASGKAKVRDVSSYNNTLIGTNPV